MKKRLLVVGGGTAGWLTAMFVRKMFPEAEVTVIEDKNSKVIGVGESTVPAILDVFNFIDVPIEELIKNCGATIKNSIKFTNWNGDGDSYYHGFNVPGKSISLYNFSKASPYSFNDIDIDCDKSFLFLNQLYKGKNLNEVDFPSKLSMDYKIPLVFDQKKKNGSNNKIEHFNQCCYYALHFNGQIVSKYLRTFSHERNINIVDGLVIDCDLDQNKNIKSVLLEDNRKIDCDFIFDCTGFSRFFIDKIYKSEFKSYKKYLPIKRAIPFYLDNKKRIPPYTEAISMKNGWMWKIPVEERFGCGYAFDSDYCTDDECYEEICKFLNFEPEFKSSISFEPGYYKKVWNNNVLSLGLSSGFIEPLEATSIWVTVMSLTMLTKYIAGIVDLNSKIINEYNIDFEKKTDSILNIVYFHYLNKRQDTPFWKEFREKNQHPESIVEILETFKYRTPFKSDKMFYDSFAIESWLIVAAGNKYFSNDVIENEFLTYNVRENIINNVNHHKENLRKVSGMCIEHDSFIKYMKG